MNFKKRLGKKGKGSLHIYNFANQRLNMGKPGAGVSKVNSPSMKNWPLVPRSSKKNKTATPTAAAARKQSETPKNNHKQPEAARTTRSNHKQPQATRSN